MTWLILDAIQGHAPRTEGEDYGEVPADVMYPEILKYPEYKIVRRASRQASSRPAQGRYDRGGIGDGM
jgi:hypothetical protein